jgi:hypothetical protein
VALGLLTSAALATPSPSIGQPAESPAPAMMSPPDPARNDPPRLFTRGDAWFGAGVALAVGAVAMRDRRITDEAIEADSRFDRRVSRAAEHLGNPLVIGPALALAWGAGLAAHDTRIVAGSERIALTLAVTAAETEALKLAVGRSRPYQSPDDAGVFQPFSGDNSFPSGHATFAFALATALDREARSPWVRWTAFPLAGLVAWSRVRDDKHWASDVVAGAALGAWTAAKVERIARARWDARAPFGLRLDAGPSGLGLGARVRF